MSGDKLLKPNLDRGGIGVAAVDPTWGDARRLSRSHGTWVGGGPRRLSWATHGHSGLTSRLWRPLSAGVPAPLAPSAPPVLAPSNLSTRLGSPSCLPKGLLLQGPSHLPLTPPGCPLVQGWLDCRFCAVPASFYPKPGLGVEGQSPPLPELWKPWGLSGPGERRRERTLSVR